MSRNTCEFVVGQLLEIRLNVGYRLMSDIDEMGEMIRHATSGLPHLKYSIVADWRKVHVMAPDIAVRAREMFANINPRVVRSALLTLPENPMTNLQVVRLIREAQNANRQHFTSPLALHAWLSEMLTGAESARLKTFLDL